MGEKVEFREAMNKLATVQRVGKLVRVHYYMI